MNRKVFWALLGITVLGATVRIVKFDYGLPGFFVPDTQTVSEAMDLGSSLAVGDFKFFAAPQKYPLISPYLILFLHGIFFAGGKLTGIFSNISEFLKFIALNQEYSFFLARGLSVAAGILIIFLSFFSAKALSRHFSQGNADYAGLAAAALTASSLLLVHFSLFERPHILLGATTLFSYFCYLKFLENSSLKWVVALAFASALAAGILQSGMLAVVFTVLGFWKLFSTRAWKKLLFGMLVFLIVFFAGYPSLLLSPRHSLTTADGRFDFTLSGGRHEASAFGGEGIKKIFSNIFVYDPIIATLAFLALAYLLLKKKNTDFWRADRGAIFIYFLGFIALFGARNDHPPRFDIPIVIFLSIFSSVVAARLFAEIKEQKKNHLISSSAYCLLLIIPIIPVLRLDYLLLQPDTRTQASTFVSENLPTDSILIENNSVLILPPTKNALDIYKKAGIGLDRREGLLVTLNDDEYPKNARTFLKLWKLPSNSLPKLIQEINANYLIISNDFGFTKSLDPISLYANENLIVQKKFTPYAHAETPGASSVFPADFENPLRDLWSQKYLGPEIRVYQIKN